MTYTTSSQVVYIPLRTPICTYVCVCVCVCVYAHIGASKICRWLDCSYTRYYVGDSTGVTNPRFMCHEHITYGSRIAMCRWLDCSYTRYYVGDSTGVTNPCFRCHEHITYGSRIAMCRWLDCSYTRYYVGDSTGGMYMTQVRIVYVMCHEPIWYVSRT